jgi:hypothetical protein
MIHWRSTSLDARLVFTCGMALRVWRTLNLPYIPAPGSRLHLPECGLVLRVVSSYNHDLMRHGFVSERYVSGWHEKYYQQQGWTINSYQRPGVYPPLQPHKIGPWREVEIDPLPEPYEPWRLPDDADKYRVHPRPEITWTHRLTTTTTEPLIR